MRRLPAGAVIFDDGESLAAHQRLEALVAHVETADKETRHLLRNRIEHPFQRRGDVRRAVFEGGAADVVADGDDPLALAAGESRDRASCGCA